ncbi:hypothetical protein [Ornatilinea apprima]|uniref:hypothetical protein n=1 Tax=Ornatilinea apprima TaxID=1134406 RepID=UPI00128EC149|nr:hypothetical protein [Ornatilinea apprima]
MYIYRGDIAARGNYCTANPKGIITERCSWCIMSGDAVPETSKANKILADQPYANCLTLRGFATFPLGEAFFHSDEACRSSERSGIRQNWLSASTYTFGKICFKRFLSIENIHWKILTVR